ncbi:MAG TPA: hypothetical protein VNO32_52285 [Candidatus Acidoferrum sp.]|jgi:hypothetical protein|nr:hypothetical protein [Candidatus Acidoferrum sp.]
MNAGNTHSISEDDGNALLGRLWILLFLAATTDPGRIGDERLDIRVPVP